MNNESQNIEYKQSWRDEYLKWICGFANAQGGTIYIGIDDDGKVCGIENAKRLMEDIPNKIVTTMGIVVDVNLYEQEELEYIEAVIEPSNIPINYKGKYYYRSGSTMQELRGPALQQFVLKKMGRSWDDIANEYATIDDLDRGAIDYFLRRGIKAGRISEEEADASTLSVLENLHLLSDDGKLKNAALLLFAKNPQRYFTCVEFRIGRFRKDEADLVTQDVIEGNIIQMADRVMELLQGKYLVSPVRFEGMQRYETLEIPKEALREILYNAIAHKDYAGPDIQMHVYDDHIEVWNEGVLPEGYTEEILMGRHSSKPRNRNIANTMFKAGFIDTWGRGYMKIREGFEAAGIPMPKVQNFCGGVEVTVQRTKFMKMMHISDNVTRDVAEDVADKYTERQLLIINALKKHVADDVADKAVPNTKYLAELLGVNRKTIQRELSLLQAKEVVRWVGSDRSGYWVLTGSTKASMK